MSLKLNYSIGYFFLTILIFSCSGIKKKSDLPAYAAPKELKADVYIVTPQMLSQDIEVAGSLLAAEEVEFNFTCESHPHSSSLLAKDTPWM